MMRTHGCGALRAGDEGSDVTLCGWVHHRRDHGKVIFFDLRDGSGTVQVVVHADEAPEAYEVANTLQREYCVKIEGTVALRGANAVNDRLPTGAVEVKCRAAEVLAPSQTPPFLIEDNIDADESLRLKYRYLDLRRPEMQAALRLRHGITAGIRRYLDEQNFVEIETPTLILPTPEGARDFLVPSRLQPGSVYALPQSPQLFKQILMVAGMERYYQIARCYRDEDQRADRQLEFTQLDLEMSFVDEQDVQDLLEGLMVRLWGDLLDVDLQTPFPRMAYDECIARFGSDKPDVRFGMELTDVSQVFASSSLGIFQKVLAGGGVMLGIGVPGGATLHHNEVKRLERLAIERGAKGLAWFRFTPEGLDSPLAKHVTQEEQDALKQALDIRDGDLALVVADKLATARVVLGGLRPIVAEETGQVPEDTWSFLWMTDPPLFEWDEDEQRYVSVHHPFTAPQGSIETLTEDPGSVKARAYDLVLNGVEIGGGSIRINRRDVQEQVLEALKRDPSEFSFLLEAFGYGAPPHGGIAFGLDRMAMLMARRGTIRDVIAFPKTQSGTDPMTGAPGTPDPKALAELGLKHIPR